MAELFDYARAKNTADRLIKKFVRDAVISTPGARSGDPFNPVLEPPTTATITLVEIGYEISEIDGKLILAKDKRLIVQADAAAPLTTSSTINYNGETFTIVNCKPLSPGETVILYEVQARV